MIDIAEADQIEHAALLFDTLSGKKRLMILRHLLNGEKSVGQLSALIDARDAATSQQLGILFDRRIVVRRRHRQMIFYSLVSEEVRTILESLGGVFGSKDDASA